MKKLFSFLMSIIFSTFLLSSFVFATVSCPQCQSGGCSCSVSDCNSGMIRIYDDACSGPAKYVYVFSGSQISLPSSQMDAYYAKAFCDNSQTSECARLISSSGSNNATTFQVPYYIILISFFLLAAVVSAFFLFGKKTTRKSRK
jgi:hypothetical protein